MFFHQTGCRTWEVLVATDEDVFGGSGGSVRHRKALPIVGLVYGDLGDVGGNRALQRTAVVDILPSRVRGCSDRKAFKLELTMEPSQEMRRTSLTRSWLP